MATKRPVPPRARAPKSTPVVNQEVLQDGNARTDQAVAQKAAPRAARPPANGFCDNHEDRPAVYVTNFPWTNKQRFCRECIPPQYPRHDRSF